MYALYQSLFIQLEASHDEGTGSLGIVVSYLLTDVIFEAAVTKGVASQPTHGTTPGEG
jgi:hypothetical protein